MGTFVKVAELADLPPGKAISVESGGRSIALYNVGGAVRATAGVCPHRGGPLGEGDLDGGVITCPWHSFQFEVGSGKCLTNQALSLACHAVRIDGQEILVEL